MAVEIPVVVDIDKAFADAAKRVPQAIKPLQEYMDKNALNIQLRIDDKQKISVKRILDDATVSAKQLKTALADIDAQISRRAAAGGFDLTKGLTYSEKMMLQVAGALESKLNGVKDSSAVMSRIFTANIDKAKMSVASLTERVNSLTLAQNKYYAMMKSGSKGGALNYSKVTNQIAKANADLKVAKNNLAALEMELGKITSAGRRAAASVSAINTPAQEMAESWRRGAAYVERYNASLGVANSRMASLIKNSLYLVSLHAATRFVRNVREVTSEFEMQRVALGGIIRDTEAAEDLFKRIKAAAIKSPFEIKDLVTYTKQLSAYRIETDKLFDVTMRLADVSAGLGVDMSRLILAYGQVRAASVLRGQELRQFTEAGIPLVELLAEKFEKLGRVGTTTADVFELISQRAVPFKMIEEIFNDMTDAGGIFYKMQEKQSETLKGKWMKLKDAVSIMYDEIGNTGRVHKGMEDIMNYSMTLMQNWRAVGKTLVSASVAMVAYRISIANAKIATTALTATEVAETSALAINTVGRSRAIAALFGEAAATKAQIALGNAYVAVKTREMMATNLFTRSLYRMIAAIMANPYAVAAAGVALLVGWVMRLATKTDEAKISVEELNKTIESFDSTRDATIEADALAASYDELSEKASLSAEEEKKLHDVTKQLAKMFPEAISGVNAFGDAITINTEKVREMARVEQQAMYDKLVDDQEAAEKELEKLANKRKKLADAISSGTYEDVTRGGVTVTVGYSEKEIAELRSDLVETIEEYNKLSAAIENSKIKTSEFYEGILMNGPAKPEFLGNAWKTGFQEYKIAVEGAADATRVFSDDQIRNADSLYGILEETAKEYKKHQKQYELYIKAYEKATTAAAKAQLKRMAENEKLWAETYMGILRDYDAAGLLESKKPTSHEKDPFIDKIQERMKFMQDYKKGYDNFKKYLSDDLALSEQTRIMEKRGLAIGLSRDEQQRAASDLSQWYSEAMEAAFKQAQQKHGAKGTIDTFLAQEIKGTSNQAKTLREFQKLIQALWDAKTDLDTSEMEKNFENALKKVSDELKRSETAKNFFSDILSLTGDEDLAQNLTVSVYGDPGSEIGERIKKSIDDAMAAINYDKSSDLGKKLAMAAQNMDFREVMKNINDYPKELQDAIRTAASAVEKYNGDMAKSYAKLLMEYDDIEQQKVDIRNKSAEKIRTIEEGLILELKAIRESELSDEQKAAKTAAANSRAALAMDAVNREKALNLSRLERDYRLFFDTVGVISNESARKVAQNQKKMLSDQFARGEISLAKYKREIKAVNDQLEKYTKNRDIGAEYLSKGIDGAISKAKDYSDSMLGLASNIQLTQGGFFKPTDEERSFLKEIDKVLNFGNFAGIFNKKKRINIEVEINEAARKAYTNALIETNDSTKAQAAAMRAAAQAAADAGNQLNANAMYFESGLMEFEQYFYAIASMFEFVQKMHDRDVKALGSDRYQEDFFEERLLGWNRNFVKSYESFKSGDIFGAFYGLGEAISELINPTEKWDFLIGKQGVLVDDLRYQYGRLENEIQKAFGSDYIANYNKQLEVLYATQEAYLEQARLEREKGKKADEDAAKGYEKQAREVGDQILDMQHQLSEFFSGTDLTSAATDFANAWIDAYKEFGSTTDAMREKFNDMLQNMVTNSLAARVMQNILQPLFQQIDDMAKDGELSANEIAQIAQASPEYIEKINSAMTALMNQLTAAGYNIRQQPGQFTGIKRNIANATEESVNGLTQAMNVNNFYMSHIPGLAANVASILAIISGGTAESTTTGASYQLNNELALQYLSSLPNIDRNIAEILRYVKSVISDKSSATNINVVAVRA